MAKHMIKKIYLDMDGVIADFEGAFTGLYGKDILKMRDKKIWTTEWPDFILNKKGFETLNYWPGGLELIDFVTSLGVPVEILTSSGGEKYHEQVKQQKTTWLNNRNITFTPHVVPGRKHKKDYAGEGIVLIDDTYDVIESFNKAGGIGIHHKELGKTIERLKSLVAEPLNI
jgi:5'-nucleotidase